MAVKHLREYYATITAQHELTLRELKGWETECTNGMITPEMLEEIKRRAQPTLKNYMDLSYIMYLLDQPQRDSKKRAYQKRQQAFLSHCPKSSTVEGKVEEGKRAIEHLRAYRQGGTQ